MLTNSFSKSVLRHSPRLSEHLVEVAGAGVGTRQIKSRPGASGNHRDCGELHAARRVNDSEKRQDVEDKACRVKDR